MHSLRAIARIVVITVTGACSSSAISGTGGADEGGAGGKSASGGMVNAGGSASTGGAGGVLASGGTGAGPATGGAGAGGATAPDGAINDGADLPACGALPRPPAIDLCAQPVGGWPAEALPGIVTSTRSVQLSGTVVAVAKGPIKGGCLALADSSGVAIVALTVRGEAEAGIFDWDVEYAVPENGVVWPVGGPIAFTYSLSGGGFIPIIASLSLSHGTDVDVYVARGGSVADLSKVPLAVRQGAAICLAHEECGDWSGYDLEVQASAGWTPLPYGTTRGVAAYRVFHGGVNRQVSVGSRCADWFVADARVAMLLVGS